MLTPETAFILKEFIESNWEMFIVDLSLSGYEGDDGPALANEIIGQLDATINPEPKP